MKLKIKNSGFTLIELMVTSAIMMILISVFLANFSGNSVSRNLTIARNNLVSDLRRVQSNSLSARDITPGTPSIDYGITLSTTAPTSYAIVGDDNSFYPVRSTISTITLPPRAYFKQITIVRADGTSTSATSDEILFRNPFARVIQTYSGGTVAGSKDPNAMTTITIGSYDDATSTRTVNINGITGSVY